MLEIIIQGVVAGAAYGLWKYYNKKVKANDENRAAKMTFDKKKFLKTLAIGAIVGGVASYFGMSMEVAFGNELLYFGAVVGVEEAIKTVSAFLKHRGIL